MDLYHSTGQRIPVWCCTALLQSHARDKTMLSASSPVQRESETASPHVIHPVFRPEIVSSQSKYIPTSLRARFSSSLGSDPAGQGLVVRLRAASKNLKACRNRGFDRKCGRLLNVLQRTVGSMFPNLQVLQRSCQELGFDPGPSEASTV